MKKLIAIHLLLFAALTAFAQPFSLKPFAFLISDRGVENTLTVVGPGIIKTNMQAIVCGTRRVSASPNIVPPWVIDFYLVMDNGHFTRFVGEIFTCSQFVFIGYACVRKNLDIRIITRTSNVFLVGIWSYIWQFSGT